MGWDQIDFEGTLVEGAITGVSTGTSFAEYFNVFFNALNERRFLLRLENIELTVDTDSGEFESGMIRDVRFWTDIRNIMRGYYELWRGPSEQEVKRYYFPDIVDDPDNEEDYVIAEEDVVEFVGGQDNFDMLKDPFGYPIIDIFTSSLFQGMYDLYALLNLFKDDILNAANPDSFADMEDASSNIIAKVTSFGSMRGSGGVGRTPLSVINGDPEDDCPDGGPKYDEASGVAHGDYFNDALLDTTSFINALPKYSFQAESLRSRGAGGVGVWTYRATYGGQFGFNDIEDQMGIASLYKDPEGTILDMDMTLIGQVQLNSVIAFPKYRGGAPNPNDILEIAFDQNYPLVPQNGQAVYINMADKQSTKNIQVGYNHITYEHFPGGVAAEDVVIFPDPICFTDNPDTNQDQFQEFHGLLIRPSYFVVDVNNPALEYHTP